MYNTENVSFPVIEIFRSIQGEGSFLGIRTLFIRLAGCNLACPWCDTKESWDPNVDLMTVASIVSRVAPGEHVTITGGEPTIHQKLWYLVKQLHLQGCFVSMETNGTNPAPMNVDWVTCSPKPPMYKIHPYLHPNELKYVVTEDFNTSCISEEMRDIYSGEIWLQPDGTNNKTMQDSWKRIYKMVKCDPRFRAGVQLHKIMEVQ